MRVTPRIFKSFHNNHVLHWGVNVDESLVNKATTNMVSVTLGGRICSEKGIDLALKAIVMVSNLRPDTICKVTILGNVPENAYGREVKSLAVLIRSLGIDVIEKTVKPSDVQSELIQSDCFILPSVWDEPFSIMLLEAMATRNFCVVTSTGGSGEICKHLLTGYLCPTPTVDDLFQGIVWYIDNREAGELVRDASLSTVRLSYSMSNMADNFVRIVNTSILSY
jgi:glycosyltransferase involved in cell wall biosynthesis